ncbi:MAG TPA: TIGR01212 family radical SAM protein [Bacteroidales bacterium]|nr:TIGR01212 family radical SAM protein [Bacteroidales bacterium]
MEYLWGNNRRFNAYSDYMKRTFGGRVQKLTVDAGFTCPNRDGTRGTGGCTFCLNDAFNPSYCDNQKSVKQQLDEGITFHETRYKRAIHYLAYFQAYSNTHGSLEKMASLYEEALQTNGVIGLVIGTRPDCVDGEKLDYLARLAERYHIIIEYGIESVYDSTLNRVNRCHTFEEAVKAIEMTAERGLHAGGHIIFGLPGESHEDMMASAPILSSLPLTSIKFHQLQVFRGTRMEQEYIDHPQEFNFFSQEEYLSFIADYIEKFNPRIVIERIAGETPPRYAVIRPWGPRYDQILAEFEKLLEARDTWQGIYFK